MTPKRFVHQATIEVRNSICSEIARKITQKDINLCRREATLTEELPDSFCIDDFEGMTLKDISAKILDFMATYGPEAILHSSSVSFKGFERDITAKERIIKLRLENQLWTAETQMRIHNRAKELWKEERTEIRRTQERYREDSIKKAYTILLTNKSRLKKMKIQVEELITHPRSKK